MLLSLDISTKIVGISVFDRKPKDLVYVDHIILPTKNKENLFARLESFLDQFGQKIDPHKKDIDEIVVEEALNKFSIGKSSAHTINSLIAFNFAVRWELKKIFNLEADGINVNTARKIVGIKVPRGIPSIEKKEFITKIIESKYPAQAWDKKRTGRFKDYCYDRADAIVLALATIA